LNKFIDIDELGMKRDKARRIRRCLRRCEVETEKRKPPAATISKIGHGKKQEKEDEMACLASL